MWQSPKSRPTLGVQFLIFDYGFPKPTGLERNLFLGNQAIKST